MALHVWQATIVNERGDIQSGATVEVRHEETGALARIYSDSEGEHEVTNPMAVADDGFARFYTAAGRYRITAAKGGYSRTWRHVEIGQYPQTAAEAGAGVTPTNYAEEEGVFERYGAIGDGTADDTSALQAALKRGGKVKGKPGRTYKISSPLYCTVSGTTVDLTGCTVNQVTAGTPFIYVGRTEASSTFVKVDRFKLIGGTITGSVVAGGSAAYCVTIIPPLDDPYVNGNGCDDIEVSGTHMSGFTGGVIATGASNVKVHHCTFGGMVYHAALAAGGYGCLMQTCFEVDISHNYFKAQSGDRHAVYISKDPSRTANNDNVCKGVVLNSNRVDWRGTSGATGFELAFAIRAAERFVCNGNTFIGGYGCVAYSCDDGNGYGPVISNNSMKDFVAREAITFLRSTGSYLTYNASVTGNTIEINTAGLNGAVIAYVAGVCFSGNMIRAGNITAGNLVNFNECTDILEGNNTYVAGLSAGSAVSFSGTCDKVTINKSQISGVYTSKYRYFANPTNIEFGFARRASISWASGVATINDPDGIIASAASDPNGFTITFQSWVTSSGLAVRNLSLLSASSAVGSVYRRGIAGQVVTIGVTNHSGAALPAAANDYSIGIQLLS